MGKTRVYNGSGNKLISLVREVELVACNGRQLVSEPEWTRVKLSLDLKFVHFNGRAINARISGNVIVESTDIGPHFSMDGNRQGY